MEEQDVKDSKFFGNPLGLGFVLKAVGVAARILKETGCIEFLRGKAEATPNPLDNAAVKVLASILDTLASL